MTLMIGQNSLKSLWRWLPTATRLRVLDIGCGTAEEVGVLLASSVVAEFVGVDLDETAIVQARARWPGATFLCADAAHLSPEDVGYFDAALVRRPDLFAQPERWRQVFGALPALLQPGGRVILTLIGEAEASIARDWLGEVGLSVIHAGEVPEPGESHLLVAEGRDWPEQATSPLALIQLDADAGEGMACDPLTGACFMPDMEVLDDNRRD